METPPTRMLPFESERLIMSPLDDSDFDHIYSLQSNAEVMRYIRPPYTDPAELRQRMEFWKQYSRENPGMGLWVARLKATGERVGNCVFRHLDHTPGNPAELGYMMAPEWWGKGLATEMIGALLRYASEVYGAPVVKAITEPNNLASQGVLKKNGFRYEGKYLHEGDECFLFVWEK